LPELSVLQYGTNQNVSCIRQYPLLQEQRARDGVLRSAASKKKVLIWSECVLQQLHNKNRQKFINLTLLPRVSAYKWPTSGSRYRRKVQLRLTELEMCRCKTEIRVLNCVVKVKVKFNL